MFYFRTVVPFSRLKPKEQGAKSGYRDLSGYYRKHENSQDNNSPRMYNIFTFFVVRMSDAQEGFLGSLQMFGYHTLHA